MKIPVHGNVATTRRPAKRTARKRRPGRQVSACVRAFA